ncbi:MAG: tRNA (adenosine(37)-N6)-dimethylallyltransferase [Patescibacteria group bacterium]
MRNRITVITGQTATGKTQAAVKLAQNTNGALINFDARQIYQRQDIVPGKDVFNGSNYKLVRTKQGYQIGYYLIDNIPVWLYDIISTDISFSAFTYAELSLEIIKELLDSRHHVIIVGGTYYYLYHLLYQLPQHPAPDISLRNHLQKKTIQELQQMVHHLDPELYHSLNQSERHNPQRLMRKIEILKHAGSEVKLSQQHKYDTNLSYKINKDIELEIQGYLYEDKELLREAITKRVVQRLSAGAIEETQNLMKLGFTLDDPGMQAIGYKQITSYLNNTMTYEDMKDEWITKEVQYGKRQLTFMKKDPNITWRPVDR